MEIEEVKELLENKKFNELKNKLSEMKCADISTILDELDKESVIKVFRILSKEKAGMTFSYMESDMREKLIQDLTDAELKNVMDELFMDDTVDLIEEMPSNIVPKILKVISKEDRKTINELLKYPEDSAGSIMTTEFIDLKETMTVEQALQRIRKIGLDSETIYTCYVLSENRILQGIINIKDILLSKKEKIIKDLMETNIISVTTEEDKEEVAKKFDKYDFYALPVVDKENRLVSYHEAGHAVVSHYLPTQDPVHQISIIPRGMAGGYTMYRPTEDKNFMSKTEMEENIVSLLGGRVAESLILNDISTGASNDIERATAIARNMVTKYGMSERLGTITLGSDQDEVFLGRDIAHAKNYSEETAGVVDEEIKRIIDNAYNKARQILTEHVDKLHAVAGVLLEKEKIEADEFEEIFGVQ